MHRYVFSAHKSIMSVRASDKVINNLQLLQNCLARVICNIAEHDQHTIDLLRRLYWLPVRSRINLKMATLCFKAHQCSQPGYLNTVPQAFVPVYTLRLSDQELLVVPASKTKTAARRFSIAAPTV